MTDGLSMGLGHRFVQYFYEDFQNSLRRNSEFQWIGYPKYNIE